jgi:glycosyltransferase involved in cell wall biosynthesis
MKIAVDIRVLMDKHYSGIAEYTDYLLRNLLSRTDDNEYVFYYNSLKTPKHLLEKWQDKRITFVKSGWPNKIFNYCLQKFFAWPKLDKVVGPVDVFWSPHINFSSFGKSAVKKIITIHDLSFLRYPEFFNFRKNFWHRNLNIKKLLKQYDCIVAISENTKRDLIELLQIPEEKITVIYSGLNKETCEPQEVKELVKTPFILYLGTIEPRKNVSGLIEAYNLLRDRHLPLASHKLVLAGGNGWKNKHIYSKAKDSLYRDDIYFLGYVSREEREWLYRNARLFVYPSYYEGFGFPPLEAMARGLATITSDVSSLPEVVSDAALTVNPYSSLDLARAIESMLLDNGLRASYAKKGIVRSTVFTWNETADNYLKLFDKKI